MDSKKMTQESNELDEASPLPWYKQMGYQARKMLPGAQGKASAEGKLEAGKMANSLMVDYKRYLGTTGKTSTDQEILNFLQKNGFPLTAARKVIANPNKYMESKSSEYSEAATMRNLMLILEARELHDNVIAAAILAAAQERLANSYFNQAQQDSESGTTAVSNPAAAPAAPNPQENYTTRLIQQIQTMDIGYVDDIERILKTLLAQTKKLDKTKYNELLIKMRDPNSSFYPKTRRRASPPPTP